MRKPASGIKGTGRGFRVLKTSTTDHTVGSHPQQFSPPTQHPGSVFSAPLREGKTIINTGSSKEPVDGGLRASRKSLVLPLMTVEALDGIYENILHNSSKCFFPCCPSCNSTTLSKHARQKAWAGWTYSQTPSFHETVEC